MTIWLGSSEPEELPSEGSAALPTRHHRFDVGQPVSYGGDDKPDIGEGGHEIVRLRDRGGREPQYAIRNADQL